MGSEVAQLVLPGRIATGLGVAAGGALAVVLTRVQRLADRVADATMPHTRDTETYLARQRLKVYRVALEETTAEGDAGPDEEPLLSRLREELDVSDREHAVLLEALRTSGEEDRDPLGVGRLFLGRYRVLEPLGRGGAGETFLCEDTQLGRRVVVKRLIAGDPAGGTLDDVLEEARALAAIEHPNVLTVYDVEVVNRRAYLVMEHAPGGSLSDHDPGPDLAAAAGLDLLAGLEAAHRAGIVHRDVKPDNVLVGSDGRFKLADFGIATDSAAQETLTGLGDRGPGTLLYMSPEQAGGRPVDERSDLYSAAVTIHEALTGRRPVEADPSESPVEARVRIAGLDRDDLRIDADGPLETILERALAPDPGERYPDAAAMREAFEGALGIRDGRPAADPGTSVRDVTPG